MYDTGMSYVLLLEIYDTGMLYVLILEICLTRVCRMSSYQKSVRNDNVVWRYIRNLYDTGMHGYVVIPDIWIKEVGSEIDWLIFGV